MANAIYMITFLRYLQNWAGLDSILIPNEPRWSVFSALENTFHHIVPQPVSQFCRNIGLCEPYPTDVAFGPPNEKDFLSIITCNGTNDNCEEVASVQVRVNEEDQTQGYDDALDISNIVTTPVAWPQDAATFEPCSVRPFLPLAKATANTQLTVSPTVLGLVEPTQTSPSTPHKPYSTTEAENDSTNDATSILQSRSDTRFWLDRQKRANWYLLLCFPLALVGCLILALARSACRNLELVSPLLNTDFVQIRNLKYSLVSQQALLRKLGTVSSFWRVVARRWKNAVEEAQADREICRKASKVDRVVAKWLMTISLAVKAERDKLRMNETAKDQEIEQLKKEVAKLGNSKVEVDKVRKDNERLKKEKAAANLQVQKVKHEIAAAKESAASLETDLVSMTSNYETETDERKDFERKYNDSSSELADTRRKLAEVENKNNKLEDRCARLEKRCQKQKQEHEQHVAKHQTCHSDDQYQYLIKAHDSRRSRDEYNQLLQSHSSCVPAEEVEAVKAALEEKKLQVFTKERTITNTKKERDDARAEVKEMDAKFLRKDGDWQEKLTKVENRHGAEILSANDTIKTLTNNVKELRDRLQAQEERHAQELLASKQAYDTLRGENEQAWTEQLMETETARNDAWREAEEYLEEVQKLRRLLLEYKEEINACQTRISNVETQDVEGSLETKQLEFNDTTLQTVERPGEVDAADSSTVVSKPTYLSEETAMGASTPTATTSNDCPPANAPTGPKVEWKAVRRAGRAITEQRHMVRRDKGLPFDPQRIPVPTGSAAATPFLLTPPRRVTSSSLPLPTTPSALVPTATPPTQTAPASGPENFSATVGPSTAPSPAKNAAPTPDQRTPSPQQSRLPRPLKNNGGLQASKYAS